jgi:hypothetical protein
MIPIRPLAGFLKGVVTGNIKKMVSGVRFQVSENKKPET